MKFLKHSKIKNTAIIFDVLTRQMVSEAMSSEPNRALKIIKRYFNSDSILYKELGLYRGLVSEEKLQGKDSTHVLSYIDMVVSARKRFSEQNLKRAKFAVIKSIKETYGDEFIDVSFNAKIRKYKQLASAYKLFEFDVVDNPSDIYY